jgi:hypothetical protein
MFISVIYLVSLLQVTQSWHSSTFLRQSSLSKRSISMSKDSDAAAKSWNSYFDGKRETKYQIIAGPKLEEFAQSLVNLYPERLELGLELALECQLNYNRKECILLT